MLVNVEVGHRGSTSPTGRTYWLDLFTGTTWQEFLDAGATVSGFRERRWKTVQQIKPGDYFRCYLTGVSRFIGVLEVISEPYWDESPVWKDEVFPCRVKVEVIAALNPETAVPKFELKEQLKVNRPTFSRLTPPLNRICSYISFSTLRQNMETARAAGGTAYLKPDFLQALAEPCLPDEV